MADAPRAFDAVVLAASPHATTVLCGLSLRERGLRVARRVGARRVLVVDTETSSDAVRAWAAERGDAGLLVVRAGDQLVHPPLVQPLVEGAGARRLAVGPSGDFAGALYAEGAAAGEALDAIAAAPSSADGELAAAWADAARIAHGDIARHAATTPAELRGATQLLLRILVKKSEDSPITQYIYRPASRPLTRALVHTPITPNQVSYLVAVIGLVGCFLTSRAGQTNLIVGAALVFVAGIIDGCDGEIARLKLTSSAFGAWLDTIVDEGTTFTYLIAIGYHTYRGHPEAWLAGSIVFAAVAMLWTVYAIYFFCIVVLKRGASQCYVGDLVIVDAPGGPALAPRPRAASTLPPWLQTFGRVMMYTVRRDFVNVVALVLTFFDAYEVIYALMAAGTVIAAIVTVPEHFKLRAQLRTLRARGGSPRYLAA